MLFDDTAIAYDTFSRDASQEWRRKVRTLAGNWQLLGLYPNLANPFWAPCWWRFFSHKLSRLIVPFVLPVLLVSGAIQYGVFPQVITWLQVIVYGEALAGALFPGMRKTRLVNFSYFFVAMNLAVLVGLYTWLTGQCGSAWKKENFICGADRVNPVSK